MSMPRWTLSTPGLQDAPVDHLETDSNGRDRVYEAPVDDEPSRRIEDPAVRIECVRMLACLRNQKGPWNSSM